MKFSFPLSLLIFTFVAFQSNAQLSGTYTIGAGTTNDFNSFNEAVDTLISQGIQAPVIFLVDSGNYREQFRIPHISGVSATNTILFKSRYSTPATLTFDRQTQARNYLIQLDSASFISFRELILVSQADSQCRLVHILKGSHHNNFDKVSFYGSNITSTSTDFALVYSLQDDDSFHTFDSCDFNYGSYGIYFSGTENEIGNVVTNCSFKEQYFRNVYFSFQSDLLIENNDFSSNSSVSSGYFSSLRFIGVRKNIKVLRNNIHTSAYGFNIIIADSEADSLHPFLIANNFIENSNSTTALGIFIESSRYINIYNNSVYLSASGATGTLRAINIQVTNSISSHLRIFNNIIQNNGSNNSNGTAYGIISWQADTIYLDYNCFYVPNSYIGSILGLGTGTSITTWRNATGQSAHSFVMDPKFYSNLDLHVSNTSIDSTGTPINEIKVDIDGEQRNATHPEIGADEIDVTMWDLGIFSLESPTVACAGDTVDLIIRVRNSGSSVVDSFKIDWNVNGGAYNTYTYKGQLNSSADVLVNLGKFTFNSTSTNYLFTFKVYDPNGQSDMNGKNDVISPEFNVGISGTYSIGSGRDFPNINKAVNYIAQNGICGPVVFELDSGIYYEQFTLTPVTGSSAINTITFTSKTKNKDDVIIRMTGAQWTNNHVAKISCSYVTFEHLTFENTTADNGNVIRLQEDAHDLVFKHNSFITVKNALTGTAMSLVYLESNQEKNYNILFDSNEFHNGSYGIYLYGYYSKKDKDIGITNNKFYDQYSTSVYTTYLEAPYIKSNTFEIGDSASSSFIAIRLYYTDSNTQVLSNNIWLKNGGTGIYSYYSRTKAYKKVLIANNAILIEGNSTNARGMYIYGTQYGNIFFNTISIWNKDPDSRAIYIRPNNTQLNFSNNIFANFADGYAFYTEQTSSLTLNYNDYYTTGATLGYWNGTNIGNFSNWQSTTTMESSGHNFDPEFKSSTILIPTSLALSDKGDSTTGITTDITGKTRHISSPDIGAYEYDINEFDAGISGFTSHETGLCDGSTPIQVLIRNYGSNHLDSVIVEWEFNGIPQTSVMVYPGIDYHQDYLATLTYKSLNADSVYSISAKTSKPNNKTDEDNSNDSNYIEKIKLVPRPQTPIVLNDSICSGNQAVLKGGSKNAAFYRWYDSMSGGTTLGNDSIFMTPALNQETTYYFEAGSPLSPDSFKTTLEISNPVDYRSNAMMMDLVALSGDLFIDSFDIHTESTGNELVWIYYKKNTYVGHSGKKSSWTLLDSVFIEGQGYRNLSRVAMKQNIRIADGDTMAFYIVATNFIYFTKDLTKFSNSDLLLDQALAMDANFEDTFSNAANFSGQIFYSMNSYCNTARVPVTAYVDPIPVLPNLADTSFCSGLPLTVEANIGSSFTYEWRRPPSAAILSSTTSLLIDTLGYYTLTVRNGCGETDAKTFLVDQYAKPNADFNIPNAVQCLSGNEFSFDNTSSITTGKMNYFWDFGDGDTSHKEKPAHAYTTVDSFKISLYVESDMGCKDSAFGKASTLPVPDIQMEINDTVQCLNENVFEFKDKSSIQNDSLTNAWYFGDGDVELNKPDVAHSYNTAASYTVKLIGISSHGCSDSMEQMLYITANPMVDLGPDTSICLDSSILIEAGNNFDTYLWSNYESASSITVDSSGTGEGTSTIWVKVEKDGCAGYDTILITFEKCINAIQELSGVGFKLYPNPSKQFVYMETDYFDSSKDELYISLIDLYGRIICNTKTKNNTTKLDVSKLAKGNYIIRIIGNKVARDIKILVD